MTENEWTRIIANKLAPAIVPLMVSTQQKIPYLQEIESYNTYNTSSDTVHTDWIPNYRAPDSFETDMTVYEKKDGVIIPLVIIEAKIKTVTTHDAITYSRKAELHKNVMPFLRYGIMLGNRKGYPLPGRLFRHGGCFDFMFSFKGFSPEPYEWDAFVEMIKREIEYSRNLEEMLHESRKPSRKRYFMFEKQLVLGETTG